MRIETSGQICGALIHDMDLREPPNTKQYEQIRAAWLEHQVIAFTNQDLTLEQLTEFSNGLGPAGDDPFIAPMPGHKRIIEVRREPDEDNKLFADNWHSDWSFMASPPAGTLLYGSEIPPVGGDTLFCDLYSAYDALPDELQTHADSLTAVHSARRGYSPKGRFGEKDKNRSMDIRPSDTALATQVHPLVRVHPETGRKALFASPAYTIGFDQMSDDVAKDLLAQLFEHLDKEQFVYRHQWQPGMLTLWDNRCLNHRATGGYEGHRRLLYRITIGEQTNEITGATH